MAKDIDEYIATSPADVRPILRKIRATIRAAAPGAHEIISYRMPAFRMHGVLVYFAAFKAHIGLYPPISGDAGLKKALAPYAGPKGNLKFPLDRPIPYALIRRIVRLRVKQDRLKAQRTAERIRKPQSQVVREAVQDYADRVGRLSERERRQMLATIDTIIGRRPTRTAAAVDRELDAIRTARQSGGRRHRS